MPLNTVRHKSLAINPLLITLLVIICMAAYSLFADVSLRSNLVMVRLANALFGSQSRAEFDYPVLNVAFDGGDNSYDLSLLDSCMKDNTEFLCLPHVYGRVALADGQYELAVEALLPLRTQVYYNPLLYEDLVIALAYGGQAAIATGLYEEIRTSARPLTPRMSEALAFAYLEQAEQDGWANLDMLNAALSVRPYDLAANYYSWQIALNAVNITKATTLRTRIENESSFPQDEPLWEYTLPVVAELASNGMWSLQKTSSLAAFLAWTFHNPQYAVTLLQRLADQFPQQPHWRYYLGDAYLRVGDLEEAATQYRTVLVENPGLAAAQERMGWLAQQQAQQPGVDRMALLDEAAFWYMRRHSASSDDLSVLRRLVDVCTEAETLGQIPDSCKEAALQNVTSLTGRSAAAILEGSWLQAAANATPSTYLNQDVIDGWILEGYTVDEERLLRHEPSDVVLFWRQSKSAAIDQHRDGWHQVGDRWIQIVPEARNLVAGGDFELGMGHDSLPVGSWTDIYDNLPSTRRLTSDVLGTEQSTAAVLRNSDTYSYTSFATTPILVSPDAFYLQSGWVRSEGGSGWMGLVATSHHAGRSNREEVYLVRNQRSSAWKQFSAVTQPADGMTSMQIWLLNHYADGDTYFDRVWLVNIGKLNSSIPYEGTDERN